MFWIFSQNKLLAQQISTSPNYPKLIYLQLRMKRYLKRKHYKSKKSNPSKQTNNNNINVNINLNVNMDNNKPTDDVSQQKPPQVTLSNTNPELKMQTTANNTTANTNVHINTNNNVNQSQTQQQQQQQALNGYNIVIPSVKAEFKESILFSTDPFLKHKKTT